MSILTDPHTGEQFEFFTRAEWGARGPKAVGSITSLANGVFGHHTVTGTQPSASIVRGVQNFHMDGRGWNDIAYSFLYDNDGRIYEGRGWGVAGGHTRGYNHTSYAFCFIGNSDNDQPSDKAFRAFNALLRMTEQRHGAAGVRGHRDVAATGCPGRIVYDWIRAGRPTNGGTPSPPPPPPPPPPPQPSDILNQVITDGSHPDAIRAVQGQLAFWGLYPKNQIDGIWGPNTEGGVKQLQSNLNNAGFDAGAVDGVWGPKTYGAYKAWLTTPKPDPDPAPPAQAGNYRHWNGEVLKRGSKGNAVAEVQFLLNINNGPDKAHWLAVDGDYGPATEAEVKRFQQVYNVFFDPNIGVDGKFGPQTGDALAAVLRSKGVWG